MTAPHDWRPMNAGRGFSCAVCALRKWRIPGGRGGLTRYTYPNGACHDSVTVDEPSCDGPPVDFALRPSVERGRAAVARVVASMGGLRAAGVKVVDGEDCAPRQPMTRAEALAEARRRWGPLGYADEGEERDYISGIAMGAVFMVGRGGAGTGPGGEGPTWEAAFADADRRAGAQS